MKIDNLLQKSGLRRTPVRMKVLELLHNNSAALTHSDLENSFETIDRVTLYRTLKSFEDKGLIHRVVDGTGVDKYALCEHECDEHHHEDEHIHFNCNKCGHTYCIDEINVPVINMPNGYQAETTNVIVKGVCVKCN